MGDRQAQIRQKLERQIKQRSSKVEQPRNSFDLSSSFYDDIEMMKEEFQHEKQSNYRALQGNQLQLELSKQRQALNKYQLNIDKLRIKMLEISKEENMIRDSINQKRKYYNELKVRSEKQHKSEMQKLQKAYQGKKQSILQQIQVLIGQKGQFLTEVEKVGEEIKKADNRNKLAQQRYNKEMKSRKEAFISIEREKFKKEEAIKTKQLKEKAIKDVQPKLLAIIKSSNDDRKKAEEDERKKVDQFKIEYKLKLQKDLTDSKQKLFEQVEQEKQKLRLEIERKNRQKYEQKQKQIEMQLQSLRQQYAQRIKEEQKNIRKDMQQFIFKNKDAYNSNIQQIKQLKSNYESKLKKMNENLQQSKERKLIQYEQKYRKSYQQQIKQVNETTEQKFKNAQQKIKKDVADKIGKIKAEISKQKNVFGDDINKKYQKMLLQQKSKMDQNIEKEKKNLEEYQLKIIDIQKQKSKQQAKAQQLQRDRNSLLTKNQDLQRKIASHQAEIQAYERYKFQKEKQIKKKCDDFGVQMQAKFQKLRDLFLKRQNQKNSRSKSLIDEFQSQKKAAQDELYSMKVQIEQKIKSKRDELKKLLQQNSRLERENELLQKQIAEQSKRMRN